MKKIHNFNQMDDSVPKEVNKKMKFFYKLIVKNCCLGLLKKGEQSDREEEENEKLRFEYQQVKLEVGKLLKL